MAREVPTFRDTLLPAGNIAERGGRRYFGGSIGYSSGDGGRGLATLADRLDRIIEFRLADQAERARIEGTAAGRLAGDDPNFKPSPETTIRAMAYNRAALETFARRLEIDARGHLDALEQQHQADPHALAEAAEAYRKGVEENIPAEARVPFRQAFDVMARPALNRSRAAAEKAMEDQRLASFHELLPGITSAIQRNARSAATDGQAQLAVAQTLEDFDRQLAALGPREAFSFGGKRYEADPTRAGAMSLVRMTELRQKLRDEAAENTVMGIWAGAPKTQAWIERWKKREYSPEGSGLREEQIERLGNAMYADLAKLNAGADVQKQRFRDLVPDHLASLQATGQGLPGIDAARAEALLGPEAARRFRQAERLARDIHGTVEGLKFAAPEEAQRLLAGLKPAPGTEGFEDRQRAFERAAAQYQHLRAAFAKDPALYVAEQPGVVDRQSSFAAQRRLGVADGAEWLLPKAKAEAEVAAIVAAKPEDKADAMRALAEKYGADWPYVYRDLIRSKLPEEFRVLATTDNAVARVRLAEALSVKPAELRQALKPTDAKDVDAEVREAAGDFARTVQHAPDGPQVLGAYLRAAEALAYRYVQGGADAKPAARRAVAELLDERYDYVDTARAPKGLGAKAEQWGQYLLSTIAHEDLQAPAPRRGEKLTEPQRAQRALAQARRGRWIPNADDTGWIRLDEIGQPVRRRDGSILGFTFRDMGDVPRAATIEGVP